MRVFDNLRLKFPTASADDPHTEDVAALRLALAVRGWVDPTRLLLDTPPIDRAAVLDGTAADVQTNDRDRPGLWFLRDQERARIVAAAPADTLAEALRPRDEVDRQDPVRRAFELRRGPLDGDLLDLPADVLQALASTFVWLDPASLAVSQARDFWFVGSDAADRRRVAASLARRRRLDDVERMTRERLFGRDDVFTGLVDWASARFDGRAPGRLLYLSGLGGSGKSTVFAHLEKRLSAEREPPLLVHIDCDSPAFDPTDPVALDLALLSQLSVAAPDLAPELMARADGLSAATTATDTDYAGDEGRRGRRRKAEAEAPVESYVALEGAVSQKSSERSSIVFEALASLGGRTLIILFDTAELMLARTALVTSSEIATTTAWFASLVTLMGGRDVRVLMAGRNPPTDPEVEALTEHVRRTDGWQVDPPKQLGELEPAAAVDLLSESGLPAALAKKAAAVLPRLPLVLKIACDVYAIGGESRAGLLETIEQHKIDPAVAQRYLTQRIILHLASAVARPHVLAAMVLPVVTEPLLAAAVLPMTAGPVPSKRLAASVYRGLSEAGWLVREDAGAKRISFHPELRRLALDLLESDPGLTATRDGVRERASKYYAHRRQAGDAAFRVYFKILLEGREWLQSRRIPDLTPLGPAVEDLPPAIRKRAEERDARSKERRDPSSLANIGRPYGGAIKRQDVEGEGARLVRRGRAEAALELFSRELSLPSESPPTFVLQALADSGRWSEIEDFVNVERIVHEVAGNIDEVPNRALSNDLRSRIYWLTRLQLMARPGPLSERHRSTLKAASERFSGVGPVMLFPSITAVAEAFAPERGPIAPDRWFGIEGSIESETRMYLVHHLGFGRRLAWKPHLDALYVAQEDWPARAGRGQGWVTRSALETVFEDVRREVFPRDRPPGTMIEFNAALRRLRQPVTVALHGSTNPTDAVCLLRGLTTEFHRPLHATMLRTVSAYPEVGARLGHLVFGVLEALRLRTRELHEPEWFRRAGRDLGAALSLALPFIDRARRLPMLAEALVSFSRTRPEARGLGVVSRNFLEWDAALTKGIGSDWKL